MTPKSGPTQNVLAWKTHVEGAVPELFFEDQFENRTELVSTDGDHGNIRIVAEGDVETLDTSGVFGPHKAFTPLWLFERDTALTKPGKLVRELVKSIEPGDDLKRLHALMSAINEKVEYKTGTTDAATPAEQALEIGSGVCQDHAHIFITGARLMGFPARYVSGYLMTDDKTDQAASHAWAEAHVDALGWVGFDAANDVCPDEHYVRIATGLDYRDACPLSGMVTGIAAEDMKVTIKVEQHGQSQSQSQS